MQNVDVLKLICFLILFIGDRKTFAPAVLRENLPDRQQPTSHPHQLHGKNYFTPFSCALVLQKTSLTLSMV
jgi:hypothetical protein